MPSHNYTALSIVLVALSLFTRPANGAEGCTAYKLYRIASRGLGYEVVYDACATEKNRERKIIPASELDERGCETFCVVASDSKRFQDLQDERQAQRQYEKELERSYPPEHSREVSNEYPY